MKQAHQSGAFKDWTADRAVDGSTTSDGVLGSCADPVNSPLSAPGWWYVDQGTVHKVESITLYNTRLSQGTFLR